MPLVPRSMSRLMPPVWRSRWKRNDNRNRCANTERATERTAPWITRAKIASRNSPSTLDTSRAKP
ncbi:hypothetical protein D3C78_1837980 [compost metagenome]